MPEEQIPIPISRRTVLAGAVIVPVAAIRSAAQTPAKAPATGLTADQLKLVEAIANRLVPHDENGPGGGELGAQHYIDRALAGPNANEKASFIEGLTAANAFAVKSQGKPFAELAADAQDAVLTALDTGTATGFTPNSRAFFTRLRRLVLEGCFSDPYYGGNKGFAGWDLIGYPGPRLAVAPDDQKMKVTIQPVRMSVWGGMKENGAA